MRMIPLFLLVGCLNSGPDPITGDDVGAKLHTCREEARQAFYAEGLTADQALARYEACKRREGL